MNTPNPRRVAGVSRSWLLAIFIAALIALALKITLAANTYGTNDVMTWEQDLAKVNIRGSSALYREGAQSYSPAGEPYLLQPFIHPPFMIHLLRFWGFLARSTHLSLGFWMRVTCSLSDLASLIILVLVSRQLTARDFSPTALVLFAISPISIFISGFHGNTDPIMICFVLLSVYSIEMRRPPLLSGALMGIACSIKIVPCIFIPASLLYIPGVRRKLRFACAFATVFIVSGLPYIVMDPFLILDKLSSYASNPGLWGWSRLALLLEGNAQYRWLYEGFRDYAKFALLISIVLLSIGMNRSRSRLMLFTQCGLITCLFMFFTPGFGVQYLVWLVPWLVSLGATAAAAYYLSGGILIFVIYTHWSGGLPWNLANSFAVPGWSQSGFILGMACWLVVGFLLLLYIDKWSEQSQEEYESGTTTSLASTVN